MAIIPSLIVNPLWNGTPRKYYAKLLREIISDELFSIIEIWDTFDAGIIEIQKECRHVRFDVSLSPLMAEQSVCNCVSNLENTKRWIDYSIQRIQQLYFLNIKDVTISSPVVDNNVERRKQIELFEDALTTVCKFANDYGVSVSLEPFDVFVDKKRIIGTSKEIKEIYDRNECGNLYLTWDLGHICLNQDNYVESLNSLLQYIKRIHISNYNLDKKSIFYGDKHLPFNNKGRINSNDIITIVDCLKKSERDVSVGFEVSVNAQIELVQNFRKTYQYVSLLSNKYLCNKHNGMLIDAVSYSDINNF